MPLSERFNLPEQSGKGVEVAQSGEIGAGSPSATCCHHSALSWELGERAWAELVQVLTSVG